MRRHPLHHTGEEIHHLVDVADRGESPKTLAIVIGGIALIVLPFVAFVVAVAGVAAYVLSGGSWPFS